MSKLTRLLVFLAISACGILAFANQDENPSIKRYINRNFLHNLFPFSESDEAYDAYYAGGFSQSDFDKMAAGGGGGQGVEATYFDKMDYGISLPANHEALRQQLDQFVPGITSEQAAEAIRKGRVNWIVWTGGNDRFWNFMTRATLGGLDFLKTVSDYPGLPAQRANRWELLGLVNEPCFKQATRPNANRFGLWVPERIVSADCPKDPYEDEGKFPAPRIGQRGKELMYKGKKIMFPVGSSYGYASGVIGLRLFPNPDFDQKAADKWNPEKFYSDPKYYYDKDLVRPYRVGMSCAFCHVGPNPSRPPADFANPKWENLDSNPGAQYFWVDRIFDWDWKKNQDSFILQLLRTSRPGSLDTSLVSSDHINNPRTMNAVYDLPARVATALKFNHLEQLKNDETLNAQFSTLSQNLVPPNSPLRKTYNASTARVASPRVLKDGSDSVGALGALNRVYINIGEFSEEWIQNFIPLIGGPLISPFRIATANKYSKYWQANIQQTPNVALYFLAASRPDKLSDAKDAGGNNVGMKYLKDFNGPEVTHGKKLFARNCAACHSSKLPEKAYTFFNNPDDPMQCVGGSNYMKCWQAYWKYVKTPEFKDAMEPIVADASFLDGNFLSTELRVPSNLIDDQLCSPLATNALKGDIWDNFSSDSYKSLESIGRFRSNFPQNASGGLSSMLVTVPGGGRGYIRPASLISLWSTAPFLQNNSVGVFDWHGTVDGRMASFNDSINKMLNPETRGGDADMRHGKQLVNYTTTNGAILPGVMDVTTVDSFLKVPKTYLPKSLFKAITDAIAKVPGAANLNLLVKGQNLAMYKGKHLNTTMMVVKAPEPPKKNWFQRNILGIFSSDSTDMASTDDSNTANYDNNDETDTFINLGPIPAGVPVNLISNINLTLLNNLNRGHLLNGDATTLYKGVVGLVKGLVEIQKQRLCEEGPAKNKCGKEALDTFMSIAADPLLSVSNCNDFVVDRGHYFGTQYADDKGDSGSGMTAQEKADLIEYLKWL